MEPNREAMIAAGFCPNCGNKPCRCHLKEGESRASERFTGFSSSLEQTTTRGDGTLEKGETFGRDDIDFSAASHLKIHYDGEVAGSQLNGDIFSDPKMVEVLLKKLLPETLQYDQFGRAELTLDISHDNEGPIGWSGVKSIEEIQTAFPDTVIEQKIRMPGGIEETVDGIDGAWYPETARNASGQFEVVKDDSGNVKNPKAKFEPKVNMVTVPREQFQEVSKTNKLTIIIQKDRESGRPAVLTIFPGDNAPAIPTKIDTAGYKASSLGDTKETRFWGEHAFIKTE